MDATRLMTRSCVITKRAVPADDFEVDEYGNPVAEETTTTVKCELQQITRSEQTADANWQVGDWSLFLAPTTATGLETEIDGGDKVTVDDVDYEVIGPPWPARNPRTSQLTHIEARVRRVD